MTKLNDGLDGYYYRKAKNQHIRRAEISNVDKFITALMVTFSIIIASIAESPSIASTSEKCTPHSGGSRIECRDR